MKVVRNGSWELGYRKTALRSRWQDHWEGVLNDSFCYGGLIQVLWTKPSPLEQDIQPRKAETGASDTAVRRRGLSRLRTSRLLLAGRRPFCQLISRRRIEDLQVSRALSSRSWAVEAVHHPRRGGACDKRIQAVRLAAPGRYILYLM